MSKDILSASLHADAYTPMLTFSDPLSTEQLLSATEIRQSSAASLVADRAILDIQQQTSNSLVFIDAGVENYQDIVSRISTDANIVLLKSEKDGIAQINEALAAYINVSSIHIVSHGSSGNVQIGSSELNIDTLENYRDDLFNFKEVLTDQADILLYGCDIAAGEQDSTLLEALSEITGADIAASDDATRDSVLGGNWNLEVTTGEVETTLELSSKATSESNTILALSQDGLVLHLEGGAGVSTTNDGKVTHWEDQSASQNNLLAFGDPQVVSGELNGHDVIRFDGRDDQLVRSQALNNLPSGDADRSVFIVASYNSSGNGGVTYGDNESNQAFGLVVDRTGDLAVQGWGNPDDVRSDVPGVGQGWLSQSAVFGSGILTHYKSGILIDTEAKTYETDVSSSDEGLVIGAEIDGAPQIKMDIAEVIIYDRALLNSERQEIETYLTEKYDLAIDQADSNFQREFVLADINQPIAIETLPDGRMLVGQKDGRINITDPGATVPKAGLYLQIPNVFTEGEKGLLDITLDPNFATNNFFYVHYYNSALERGIVSRFVHDLDHAHLEEELIIWQDSLPYTAQSSRFHQGGGLDFGPDSYLYLAIGDKFDRASDAQDLTLTAGKVIRIDPSNPPAAGWIVGGDNDALIPDDNPFVDGIGGNLDEIWALGLRNPFRARWDIPSNRYFIGEVGGNVDFGPDASWEDLHLGSAGANFGWNNCEGPNCNPNLPIPTNYSPPIFSYQHGTFGETNNAGSRSIVGGNLYRGDLFPKTYDEVYFYGDFAKGWLRYLTFDELGNVTGDFDFLEEVAFVDNAGGITDLEVGIDGALYYTDLYSGTLNRIIYNDSNQAPVIEQVETTPTSGTSPLSVNFSAIATDAESDPLSYFWDFGDGNTKTTTESETTHEYVVNGTYSASLAVSDSTNNTLSAPINILVGSAPAATILMPSDNTLFRAGDTINISGIGSDADSTTANNNYSWTVEFIHNEHTHPEIDSVAGRSLSFEVPTSGHTFFSNTGYRITLTVTDADGLSSTDSIDIRPEKVDLTFNSNVPGGITFTLDELPRTGPFVYDSAINFEHTVSVPKIVSVGEDVYTFKDWSYGNAPNSFEQSLSVPDTDQTVTANYTKTSTSSPIPVSGLVVHLDADRGVETDGDLVTGWTDLSGLGNDVAGAGNPKLLAGALNGHDVIEFDGNGDKLTRSSGLSGLPSGNADRSLFLVSRYDGLGYGGVTYGNYRNNKAFGAVVDPDGMLSVQGWGGINDFDSEAAAAGSGWLIQEVVYNNGVMNHYKNGSLIDSQTHRYNTDVANGQGLVIGAEIDSSPYVDMDVAEILIYDEALSDAERQRVETYLKDKYFS